MSQQFRTMRRAAAVVAAMMFAVLLPAVAGAQGADDAPAFEAASAEIGYVATDADGRVAGFGTFPDVGDASSIPLAEPVVDIASTGSGDGYWLAASDGGVFSFGDATFHGSMGGIPLNRPVVAMAATPTGEGYWLVASDGGVFAFGDAGFFGSTGSLTLNSPIVDLTPTPTGEGYWMVAADGGIFAFGDAGFFGSDGGNANPAAIVGMATTATGNGYWLADSLGNVSHFGDAANPVDPVEQGITIGSGIISMASANDGAGAWLFNGEGAAYGLAGAFVASEVEAAAAGDPFVGVDVVPGDFTLTVLHNNDGESAISPNDNGTPGDTSDDFGGIAFFASTVDALRDVIVPGNDEGAILLSSGDNFLASAALTASFERADNDNLPWYDSVALDAIGYDAFAIGNHEFDFGPDRLQEFIEGFGEPVPFLSSNLDFTGEAGLQALVNQGRIAGSTVVNVSGRHVGVVGATTPNLGNISTPGDVVVGQDVAAAVQAEVDALTDDGIEIIILISHLQDVDSDVALLSSLSDVDVVIAGGGDEVLANAGDELAPGDTIDREYPIIGEDTDGVDVPVVTTAGDYRYVGRLVVTFDPDGDLKSIDAGSGPVLVKNAAGADASIQANVVDPIEAFNADLAAEVVASSEVLLESNRGTDFGTDVGKRVQESNLGDLVADALLWQAQEEAADFGVDPPQIALQNGGGIRDDSYSVGETPPFDVSRLDTFNILPFDNFVTVIEDMPSEDLLEILETAYGQLPESSGGFVQIAGMTVQLEFSRAANVPGDDPNPSVDVTSVVLDDATVVVAGGVAQPGVTVDVATIDFLAGGGDGLPVDQTLDITPVGVSYQQALENYLKAEVADGGLGGTIAAADYPVVPLGGGTRIQITENP